MDPQRDVIPIPMDKLAAPAQRALTGAGFTSLQQIALVRKADLAVLHGIGPKALRVLEADLLSNGLSFAD